MTPWEVLARDLYYLGVPNGSCEGLARELIKMGYSKDRPLRPSMQERLGALNNVQNQTPGVVLLESTSSNPEGNSMDRTKAAQANQILRSDPWGGASRTR